MKFVVMSDIHYISRRIMGEGTSEDVRMQPAVCEQALAQASAVEGADVILIHGDLVDRGDRPSHEDLIACLRQLKTKGKRVYVTTATHDFNHHKAYRRAYGDTRAEFRESPWDNPFFDKETASYRDLTTDACPELTEEECAPALEEVCTPEELWDMYREFGRDDAFSVCESAFSYCVALEENLWCLMLNDNFRNEECMHNVSVTYSPTCLRWIHTLHGKALAEVDRILKEKEKSAQKCT